MNILLLCLVSRVVAELQTIHKIYISHKSKVDGIKPTGTAFEDPSVHSTLDSVPSDVKNVASEKYSVDFPNPYYKSKLAIHIPISKQSKREIDSVTPVIHYNNNFLPTKIKTDIMYEQMKSAMHYQPSESEVVTGYYDGVGYLNDQDDVRSSSRTVYDNYPYFYNPYEYEQTKADVEIQKAKDKRYASPTRVIPIHEDLSHDVLPNPYQFTLTTDNPMNGHDPFFKFVLNDYFDKNSDEDHLTFKGLNWGKEFDHERPLTDQPPEEIFRKNRRLEYDDLYPYEPKHNEHNIESTQGTGVTEESYIKKHDFDKHEKGNGEKTYDKSAYQKQGNQYTGFKDFVDAFANKFGSEDQRKNSKFILKRDQDKGEKRKGFRRVYHKDEYQEDNEFYDNNNHKTLLEENGNASAHSGGSEGLLKSQAAAAIGNDAKAYNKLHDQEENNYENNRKGYEKMQGSDGNFNRYKDIAKFAAQSNNADYSDHYRI